MRFSCLSFVKRAAVGALAGGLILAAGEAFAALPAGYVMLEYIEADNQQYLDTGYTPTALTMGFYVDFIFNNTVGTTDTASLLASSKYNNGSWGGLIVASWTSTPGGQFTFGGGLTDPGLVKGVRIQAELKNKHYTTISAQDSTYKGQSYNCTGTDASKFAGSIYLFGRHTEAAGVSLGLMRGRVYRFKIYEGDTVVRDFVPAKNAQGAIGMIDTVGNAGFRASATATSFIAGPTVDYIIVAGSPEAYGTPNPGYGQKTDVERGTSYTFTCPSVYTNDAQTIAARNTGWRLTKADGTSTEGLGHEKSIVYGDDYAYSTLTWLWEKKVKMTATASGNGTVTMSNGDWFAVGETVTLTAVADEENRFTGWTGDGVPTGKANSNPLTFTANAPLALTANFAVDPTFYVSVDGDDNDDGSKTTPFATVSNALAKANAAIGGGATHSTIKIGTGVFDLQKTIALSRAITVTGEGIGKTVLKRDASVASLRMLELSHTSALVENLSVTNGYITSRAAGAYVTHGTVRRCEFYNCHNKPWDSGWNKGGCVVLSGSDAKAVACVIRGINVGDGCGEALWIDNGGVAESCLVCDNSCTTASRSTAYMVYVGADNTAGTLRGCTIVNNYMGNSTAVGIANAKGAVHDCIVYGNRGVTATTGGLGNGFDIAGSTSGVFNTLTTDPGFRDFTNKNYSIGPGPAIDAAKYGSSTLALTGVDAAGNARQVGTGVDIGALECKQDGGAECAFVAEKTGALEGEAVTFRLYSIGAGANPTYTINFGDGSAAEEVTGSSVTHSYAKGGKFTVTLSMPGATPYVKANAITVAPKNFYVKVGGTGLPPYTEDDPAGYIEDALAEAGDGCTIWLLKGDHKLKMTTGSGITVGKAVTIRGKTGNPDDVTVTRINTSTAQRPFTLTNAGAALRDLTVFDGRTPSQNNCGANIQITSAGGMVSNCVLRGGQATQDTTGGGAVAAFGGLVTHCVITNNYGYENGMALRLENACAENCLIADNTGATASHNDSGAVYMQGSAKLVNCTIIRNRAGKCPGVCFVDNTPTVVNCVFAGNTSSLLTDATKLVYSGGSSARFTACAAPFLLNDTCVTADDLKLTAAGVPTAKSVCRDNGTTSGITVSEKDLAGKARIDEDSGKIDIGCYEVHVSGLVASIAATPSSPTGLAPFPVSFTAEVEGGTAVSCRWFENGTEIAGETASTLHRTYETAGNYVITLKVSDGTNEYDAANTIPVAVYPVRLTVDADHSLADAYAAAGDGTVIEVAPGPYVIPSRSVEKGVIIRGMGARPADVTFKAKTASDRVFSLNHAACRLENLTIFGSSNSAQLAKGAGLAITGQGGMVTNCVIASCSITGDTSGGGGAYLASSGAVLTHCVITNCTCSRSRLLGYHSGGAAILIDSGEVRETLIADCRSGEGDSDSDGAISAYGGSVVNCTITDCRSGGCAGVRVKGTCSVVNTIISGNTTGSTNPTNAVYAGEASVFDHCLSDGDAAINANCFVEPAERTFKDLARGKFVIKGSSVGRDAGKARADAPSVDLKGRPRLFGKAIDLGCYESQAGGLSVIVR